MSPQAVAVVPDGLLADVSSFTVHVDPPERHRLVRIGKSEAVQQLRRLYSGFQVSGRIRGVLETIPVLLTLCQRSVEIKLFLSDVAMH